MNNKKAFIDQILLWFIIAVLIIGFVATVSDDKNARVKYINLKSITDHASMAAGEYYTNHDVYRKIIGHKTGEAKTTGELESEAKANYIVQHEVSELAEAVTITYTWDWELPDYSVTATIQTHTHENFWWKLFGWGDYTFVNVHSSYDLNPGTTDKFVPIAVNTCDKDLSYFEPAAEGEPTKEFEFILKAHDIYSEDDFVGFFALEQPGGGQSSFSHFKNMVSNVMNGDESYYDIDSSDLVISPVDADAIHNDVKQVASAIDQTAGNVLSFPETTMAIALLDCGTTKDNLVLDRLLYINLKDIACGVDYVSTDIETAAGGLSYDDVANLHLSNYELNNKTAWDDPSAWDSGGTVINNVTWTTVANECNSEELFKIHFEIVVGDNGKSANNE